MHWWTEWAPAWGYIPAIGAPIYQGSFEQYHIPATWLAREWYYTNDPWYIGTPSKGVLLSRLSWQNIAPKLYPFSSIESSSDNPSPQFLKLEKVEIGGIRGKALTSNINKVYEEFRVSVVAWNPVYHEHRISMASSVSVSYTHLTLPTILLV